jgi:FixJ family two-component response regulator
MALTRKDARTGKRGAAKHPAPAAGAAPANQVAAGAIATDLAGTVLVFCQAELLVVRLQLALAAGNLRIRHHLTAEEIITATPPFGPVCVVVDLDVDTENGLRLCERLKANDCQWPIIIMATGLDIRMAVRAMRAGATDILPLPANVEELRTVVEQALSESSKLMQQQKQSIKLQQRWALLTAREREIIKLIIAGMLNKQIAAQLDLALVTVKVHRGSAMRKMGARSAAELARLALTANFLESRSPGEPAPALGFKPADQPATN